MSALKFGRIQGWIRQGIYHENYDELYNQVQNIERCEGCKNIFTHTPIVEHHHISGKVRMICCRKCNHKMIKIDKDSNKVIQELKLLFGYVIESEDNEVEMICNDNRKHKENKKL